MTDLLTLVLFLLNAVMGVSMWLLKTAYNDVKENVKENRDKLEQFNREAYKKEDFREFKEELWRRLDKLEAKESKHG